MGKQQAKIPTLLQLLGGVTFGRPVWLGAKLVCTACWRVLKRSAFDPAADLRVEPVCGKCQETSNGGMADLYNRQE